MSIDPLSDPMLTKGPSEQQAYANGYADGYAAAIRERDLFVRVQKDNQGRAIQSDPWRGGPLRCDQNE